MAVEAGERRLVQAWQRGLTGLLRTTTGQVVQVIYRGTCPGGAGPDVRGALLAFDDRVLVEGDVEFHLRASDWQSHGHHGDPRYRGVILHVVTTADVPPPLDATGQPLPTLIVSLPEPAPGDDTTDGPTPCHRRARQQAPEVVAALLDELGDRRLAERAARFEADLSRLAPDQLAQEAVFEALGFSRNRSTFVRLAQAVPIALLVALLGRRPNGEALDLAEAILFGVAGLLPSQRPLLRLDWEAAREAERLEGIWGLYRRDWEGTGLPAEDWIFAGVHPPNQPARRVATAARLAVRFSAGGLARSLLLPLQRGATPSELEGLVLVDGRPSYWATHADFGRALPRGQAALLGRDRAREVVVNVVLPLALAVAAAADDRALSDAAWRAYRLFPRPASYEAVDRLAKEIGISRHIFATARRQQGLLYLLRNHCERAGCVTCPLRTR